MSKILYAPRIDHYIDCYCDRGQSKHSYDEKTTELLNKIIDEMKKLTPIADNGCRELYIVADKGSIEAFGDYEENKEYFDIDTFEEYEKIWQSYYPKEKYWYHIRSIEVEDNGYKAIDINYHRLYEAAPHLNQGGFEYDIYEFAEWLYDAVKDCIKQVEAGTYMSFVENNLDVVHRTGTILRKELWELNPDDKEEFFEGLSEEDISEFISLIEEQKKEKYLPTMTANEFYNYCSIGYKAMGYDIGAMSPKEQYYRFADGRDDGLGEIDGDSTEAFKDWMEDDSKWGGHPWEVCRGGNSTHISLFVHKDKNGYALALEGSSYGRTTETIKFYLALIRNKIPVYLWDAINIVERVRGNEKVGIVPQCVLPAYCHSMFPDEDIISFYNLPYENTKEVADKCVWQKIREIKLL